MSTSTPKNEFMKPTPTDLALIAATLSKNDGSEPEDNIAAASALWSNAALYLAETTGRARFKSGCKIPTVITLKDFLKDKMPKIQTPSLRQRRFHQFLVADYLPKTIKGKKIEGSLEMLATEFIDEAKRGGVSANSYPGLAEWYKAKVSAGHAKGGNMKHAKELAKKLAAQCAKDADHEAIKHKRRIEHGEISLKIESDKATYKDWEQNKQAAANLQD